MKAGDFEPDRFYYDQALRDHRKRERAISRCSSSSIPSSNHFPWWNAIRPELTPDWRDLGNEPEVDEYIRRQTHERARLQATSSSGSSAGFPGQVVPDAALRRSSARHGPTDHRSGRRPSRDDDAAHDGVRPALLHDLLRDRSRSTSQPKDVSSALDAARGALSARWWSRRRPACRSIRRSPSKRKSWSAATGCSIQCAGGAEARRFNRLLIDAGLIKGMVSR